MAETTNNNNNGIFRRLRSSLSSEQIIVRAQTTAFVTIINQPLKLVTKLIQLGYEPLPPSQFQFLWFDRMVLPNKITYLHYIYTKDGFFGCFRGLKAQIVGCVIENVTYLYYIKRNFDDIAREYEESAVSLLKWEILATSVSVIASHPFYVVSLRKMAQFVGGETKYKGICSSLYLIAKEEGVGAWFSGLAPKLIRRILYIVLSYSVLYVIERFIVSVKDNVFALHITSCIINSILYPFRVISACMAINQSGLEAGSPPMMPDYLGNWIRCYDHLSANNQLYRGSSLFLRTYIPPLQNS